MLLRGCAVGSIRVEWFFSVLEDLDFFVTVGFWKYSTRFICEDCKYSN